MKEFYQPSVIIFMDIDVEEAHKRILKRNRGPLRKMDQVEQMKKDKEILKSYLTKLDYIPVHYINANDKEENVTNNIIDELKGYLE